MSRNCLSRSHRYRLASLVLAFSLFGVGLAPPASAVLPGCNNIKQIFMRGNTLISNTKGTKNRIYQQNRTLDTGCTAMALSTSQINRSGDPSATNTGDWVEIGWRKVRRGDGSVDLCIFTEWGDNFATEGIFEYCNVNGQNYGEFDRYRVYYTGSHWVMATDLNEDGSWTTRDTTGNDITWSRGAPLGETERFGLDTGMVDDQRSLEYKNASSDNWNDWPDMFCILDQPDDFSPDEMSQTRYIVEASSVDVCWDGDSQLEEAIHES